MTTPRDLARPVLTPTEPSATGDTVPRRRVGDTIIVPFDDISEQGPEPIRVARLSPMPAKKRNISKDETLIQAGVPAIVEMQPIVPPRRGFFEILASVPEWAWVAGAMALFALGSFGVMLVGLAIAVYVYVT